MDNKKDNDGEAGESKVQDLGTLTVNPVVKRKPKKTKLEDGTVRVDY